ncbi:hypothetical protein EC957_001257 [Mortierella hygrophila]|uniref:Crinkler effector protein N-terminal domain-containing protein n=1 Tax=Mortierella hygrophila TaxID=979708 RepID=A0A9P6F517_9FUNG|nr:hypothetical protein EC957_001257 [Mortierella hygrophila]
MVSSITLFVVLSGDTKYESFSIDIDPNKTVGHLKQLIKEANPTGLSDIDVWKLPVWIVGIPFSEFDNQTIRLRDYTRAPAPILPYEYVRDVMGPTTDAEIIHPEAYGLHRKQADSPPREQ